VVVKNEYLKQNIHIFSVAWKCVFSNKKKILFTVKLKIFKAVFQYIIWYVFYKINGLVILIFLTMHWKEYAVFILF